MLVPQIVVTPESASADDGAVTIWVAVQLSVQGSSTADVERELCGQAGDGRSRQGTPWHELFLYDVSLELLPLPKSTVVEVVGDKACPKILHPESRLLFVAQIRLEPAGRHGPRTNHVRQKSDDLIEDLEVELGGIITEYLEVRVTYRHSGYPQRHSRLASVPTSSGPGPDGLSRIQTTIQTTATASIRRHNSASRWSPLPCTARPNRLFEVVASHWGVDKAHAVMQRVIRSRWIQPRPNVAPSTRDRYGGPSVRVSEPPKGSCLVSDERQEQYGRPFHGDSLPQPRTAANQGATLTLGTNPSSPLTRVALPAPTGQTNSPCRRAQPPTALLRLGHVSVEHGGENSERDSTGGGGCLVESHTATTMIVETSPTETVRRRVYCRRPDNHGGAASIFRPSSFTSASSASSSLSFPSSPTKPMLPPQLLHPLASSSSSAAAGSGPIVSRERARTGAELQRGLAGKWLAGGDAAPVALDPVVVDAKMEGEGQPRRTIVGGGVGRYGGMVSVNAAETGTVKEKPRGKETGWRWGWTAWW
ncbi:hypothetical protein VTH82DRAFT_4393 [Thermothelomyces myriococcoides]